MEKPAGPISSIPSSPDEAPPAPNPGPPFYFRPGYALTGEIRRIASEQVEETINFLSGYSDKHKGIHEARKRLKKIRALIRLIRFELGNDRYRELNAQYRDAGRLLSELRDASSRIEALDKLKEKFPEALEEPAYQEIKKILQHRRTRLSRKYLSGKKVHHKAAALLRDYRDQIGDWPLFDDSFGAIGPGLEKIYRQGRKTFRQAYEEPSDENFHEWRKKVKYLWHHIQLLQETWPAMMLPLEQEIHTLADYLGDDHDLAIFEEMIHEDPEIFGDAAHQELLLGLFDEQKQHLRKQAYFLGRKIFCEKSLEFAFRIEGYWKAWQEEQQSTTEKYPTPKA